MNEIPRLIVGHRVRAYYADGFVLEGDIVDAHINLFLLTAVESSRGNGKRHEKDQLVNNMCGNFVRMEALSTGRTDAMESELPKHLTGKHVRLYFTLGYVMEGRIADLKIHILILTDVKSIENGRVRPEKDQFVNTMCARFERLEILD